MAPQALINMASISRIVPLLLMCQNDAPPAHKRQGYNAITARQIVNRRFFRGGVRRPYPAGPAGWLRSLGAAAFSRREKWDDRPHRRLPTGDRQTDGRTDGHANLHRGFAQNWPRLE